jgi:hypothetical protein
MLAFPLVLLAALAAGEPDAGPRTEVVTIAGTLSEIAFSERRLTIDTPEGESTLTFDRNTAVYLARRMGTLRDLAPGQPVRVAHGPDHRAYWVEVRSAEDELPSVARPARRADAPTVVAPPRPRQVTADHAAPRDGGAPPGQGGEVPAGPGTPEPNPGARPPPPPTVAPAGPSPIVP